MQTVFQSKEDIYNLFMQTPVGLCLLKGPNYVVELANEAILDLWGKDRRVIGKPLLASLPELKEQGLMELLDEVLHTGVPFRSDETGVWYERNGTRTQKYVTLLCQPLYENGQIAGIFFTSNDVTERARSRRQLDESARSLHNVIRHAPVAMCIFTGPEHIIEIANERMVSLWGKTVEEVTGKAAFEALPETKGQGYEELLERVYREGETIQASERPVRFPRDGGTETFYLNFVYEPLHRADGTISGIIAVAVDVTEQVASRKKIEDAVEDTERQKRLLEAVTSATPDLVYVFNLNYRFTYANAALLQMWGKSWEDSAGRGLLELGYEPWHAEMHEREIDQVVATKQSIRGEVSFPHATLGRRIYDYIFSPVLSPEGIVEAVAGTTRDITEIKRAEEALRQSEVALQRKIEERTEELERSVEELRRLNQNLEEFAYAASHDLKEPVRKIHFFSDRLMSRLGDKMDSEDCRLFERMQGAAQRMGNLIDELLMYSQMTRGVSHMEDVDLNRKVHLVLEDLELEMQEKRARVTMDTLPQVKGNKRQMQQLFFNLIGNALKYSKTHIPPEIHLSYRLAKAEELKEHLHAAPSSIPYHLIEVRDNGIGFEPKDAERIFQVFTRLYGNAEYSGTGIGLSIVRKVAVNHGGWVWAESKPGEGASFKVALPVA